MNDQLKKRLIGAVALVAALVIFLPMLLEKDAEKVPGSKSVPSSSLDKSAFASKTLPLPSESGKKPGVVQPMIEPPPVFVPPREQLTESLADTQAGAKTPEKAAPEKAKPVQQAKPQAQPAKPPAPAAATGSGESWAIQVVSFSTKDKADALAAELKGARMGAFVQPVSAGGKTLYRVRIGPDKDRARLESLLGQLQTRSSTAALKPQIVHHP